MSRIRLTKRALKKLDRINWLNRNLNKPLKSPSPSRQHQHPQLHSPTTQEHLEDIFQIARNGGFNLIDLRGFLAPGQDEMEPSVLIPTNDDSTSCWRLTETMSTTSSRLCYSNFRSLLISNYLYPYNHRLPDTGDFVPSPENFDEIRERARRRRPSLSSEKFTDADFEAFKVSLRYLNDQKDIMEYVIPIIEGTYNEKGHSCCNRLFNNFKPLAPSIVCGTPDKCHGADPANADLTVRNELKWLILPSTEEDMPIAPNFFLEARSSDAIIGEGDLKALYTGALGERGQLALRSWRRKGLGLDNKAHTITVHYIHGLLQFYSIHAGRSRIDGEQLEFYMNSIDAVVITCEIENFRRGVTSYRN
ncbi:hypothetical protein EPUL_005919, partial [Erysiphe pulchra]